MNSFINYLVSRASFDISRIVEFVEVFTNGYTDETMRILSYLTRYTDKPIVPKTSTVRNNAELVEYNYFQNKVHFSYVESICVECSSVIENSTEICYESYYDIPKELRNQQTSRKIDSGMLIHYRTKGTCSLEEWLKH